ARCRRPGPHSSITLPALCAVIALVGSAWLATAGCAQSTREAVTPEAQQQPSPQSRPRRALESGNNTPPSANDRGTTDAMKGPEANSAGSGDGSSGNAPISFDIALKKALAARGVTLESVCGEDAVSRRVLADYGAMFVASASVLPPPVCIFAGEAEVVRFQHEAKPTAANIGGTRIELQAAAMQALLDAREEAHKSSLDITPRGGAEAARRSYSDTLRLWNSRFLPALVYWNKRGRLSDEQVARLRKAPLRDQVREVLELEKKGIFFSKDLSKSILYSVAAPGTSQHLSMLAFDVSQFGDARVRRILAAHGWFQTVKSDLPHFTYLGVEEKDLPALGLRSIQANGRTFWIPNAN
ncbi:MAG: hypothetical protein H0W99_14715, partial [Acidobacteria bacterium]|nr:hypothetical protein [Acidobacteriota bacterium]